MKLYLHHAIMILIAGMLLILVGGALKSQSIDFSQPIILSGLAIEFVGTIWLVLHLNQRRNKNKQL